MEDAASSYEWMVNYAAMEPGSGFWRALGETIC